MFLLSFDFLSLSDQDIVMFLGDVLENVMFRKNVIFYVRFHLRKRDVFTWFWVGKWNVFSLKKESYLQNVLMSLKWYFEENVMFLKWYFVKNAILMWYFEANVMFLPWYFEKKKRKLVVFDVIFLKNRDVFAAGFWRKNYVFSVIFCWKTWCFYIHTLKKNDDFIFTVIIWIKRDVFSVIFGRKVIFCKKSMVCLPWYFEETWWF